MLSFKYPSNAFLSKSMFLITPPTSPIEQLLNFNFLYNLSTVLANSVPCSNKISSAIISPSFATLAIIGVN